VFRIVNYIDFVSVLISLIIGVLIFFESSCYFEIEKSHYNTYSQLVEDQNRHGYNDWLYRNIYWNAKDIFIQFEYDSGGLFVTYLFEEEDFDYVIKNWIQIEDGKESEYYNAFVRYKDNFAINLPEKRSDVLIYYRKDYDFIEKYPVNHILLIDKRGIGFLMYTRLQFSHNDE
jgi:hypothetical protein